MSNHLDQSLQQSFDNQSNYEVLQRSSQRKSVTRSLIKNVAGTAQKLPFCQLQNMQASGAYPASGHQPNPFDHTGTTQQHAEVKPRISADFPVSQFLTTTGPQSDTQEMQTFSKPSYDSTARQSPQHDAFSLKQKQSIQAMQESAAQIQILSITQDENEQQAQQSDQQSDAHRTSALLHQHLYEPPRIQTSSITKSPSLSTIMVQQDEPNSRNMPQPLYYNPHQASLPTFNFTMSNPSNSVETLQSLGNGTSPNQQTWGGNFRGQTSITAQSSLEQPQFPTSSRPQGYFSTVSQVSRGTSSSVEGKTVPVTLKAKIGRINQQLHSPVVRSQSPPRHHQPITQKKHKSPSLITVDRSSFSSANSANMSPDRRKKPSIAAIVSQDHHGKPLRVRSTSTTKQHPRSSNQSITTNDLKSFKSLRCLKQEQLPQVPKRQKNHKSKSRSKSAKKLQTVKKLAHKSLLVGHVRDLIIKIKSSTHLQQDKLRIVQDLNLLQDQLSLQETKQDKKITSLRAKLAQSQQSLSTEANTAILLQQKFEKLQKRNDNLKSKTFLLQQSTFQLEQSLAQSQQTYESHKTLQKSNSEQTLAHLEQAMQQTIVSQQQQYESKLHQQTQLNEAMRDSMQKYQDEAYQVRAASQGLVEKVKQMELQCQELQTEKMEITQKYDSIVKKHCLGEKQIRAQWQSEVRKFWQRVKELESENLGLGKDLEKYKEMQAKKFETWDPDQNSDVCQKLEREIQNLKLLLKEKDEEIDDVEKKFANKLGYKKKQFSLELTDYQQRLDRLEKENSEIKSQRDSEIPEVKKQENASSVPHKVQLMKEQYRQMLRTKEEEIQMLWRVLKKINKSKESPINLQRMENILFSQQAPCGKENVVPYYQQNSSRQRTGGLQSFLDHELTDIEKL